MATDLKTQYVIELLEQGTGAKTAVADLKAVSAAAKETTAATETMTAATAASSAAFTVSAGQMKSAARTLSADLKLLALVSFPEVAAKGFAAEAALKAIGATSKLLGFSVAGVTGAMALLVPIIQSGTEAWKAHKAKLEEVRTEFDAFVQSISTNIAAVDVLARLSAAGVVSDERRNLLGMILDRGQPGPKRQAIQEIIGLQYQSGKDTAAMGQWQRAAGVAESYVGGTLTGVEGQTFSATKAWNEARQAVLNYKKEGVDTELALKQIDEAYAAVIDRIHQEKIDNLQKEDMREVESRSRRIQQEQAEAQQIKSFQDDLLEATLSGDERESFANLRTFQERMKQIQQLSLAEKIGGQEEIDLMLSSGSSPAHKV
ncbi:MAG: hypothetical protein DME24_21305 [Verrucomicrobia bacterium]|nr:MAG: hypothetical protein DME24_21305 [Verrucomicrobiota bacterium]